MYLQPTRRISLALALALAAAAGLAGCGRRPSLTTGGDEPSAVEDAGSAGRAGPFRFPRDRGGALLAELLPPAARARPGADEAVRRPLDLGDPLTAPLPELALTPLDPEPPGPPADFPAVA